MGSAKTNGHDNVPVEQAQIFAAFRHPVPERLQRQFLQNGHGHFGDVRNLFGPDPRSEF
jgi:hypothetical protein